MRRLALAKLTEEGFNAEVAATLATLVPRQRRTEVTRAMVALQVLYDLLDGLTEWGAAPSARAASHIYLALTDAVSVRQRGRFGRQAVMDETGYLLALSGEVRNVLPRLPAYALVGPALRRNAERVSQAQVMIHFAGELGTAHMEQWARQQAAWTPLAWREFVASAASSVLTMHALIAAAAVATTTRSEVQDTEDAYLMISALPTMLDSLVDNDLDADNARHGYAQLYDDHTSLAGALEHVVKGAISSARAAPHGSHHLMTVVGVFSYFTSHPCAMNADIDAALSPSRNALRPLLAPTMAVMRVWRSAKRIRSSGSPCAFGAA